MSDPVRAVTDACAQLEGPALVACSGGLDSTVLAHLVAAARPRDTAIAWFDHGWRDVRRDQRAAEDLANTLGVELLLGRSRPDPALLDAVGPEAEARTRRLGFLEAAAADRGAVVFLGHHHDDQAENALLGSGRSVRPAMPAARGPFRRPLLGCSKASLARWAREHGVRWVEDPTNDDLRFERNRIRASLPADPALRQRLVEESEVARAARDRSAARADAAWAEVVLTDRRLDRGRLGRLDDAAAIALLRRICRPALAGARGPSTSALKALLRSARAPGSRRRHHLGAGWDANVDRASVDLLPRPSRPPGCLDAGPQPCANGPATLRYTVAPSPPGPFGALEPTAS